MTNSFALGAQLFPEVPCSIPEPTVPTSQLPQSTPPWREDRGLRPKHSKGHTATTQKTKLGVEEAHVTQVVLTKSTCKNKRPLYL